MTLESLKAARRRTIGAKQTLAALRRNEAQTLYVARDAAEFVIRDLMRLAHEKKIEVVYVESMAVLGKSCGIEVGSSAAAVLKS